MVNMSAKGKRKKQMYSFTLHNVSNERLNIMSEELEMSRSEIVDRAIKAYYQALQKRGKIESDLI